MAEITFNRDSRGQIQIESRISESEEAALDKILKGRWEIIERVDLRPLSLNDAIKVLKIIDGGDDITTRFRIMKARGQIKPGVTVE